jgi:hypothetical protein
VLVFQDVPLVHSFEEFKPANQGKNNAVETSDFAVLI